jgi:Protein of unknown function (DUF2975)
VQPKTGGTGWLRAIRWILDIAFVLNALYLLTLPFDHHVHSVGIVDTADLWNGDAYVHRMHPELTPGDVTVGITEWRDNHLVFYTPLQTFLYLMSDRLAFTIVALPLLVVARRLVTRTIEEDPFTPTMVRRLRNLGLAVLLGGMVSETVEYLCGYLLMRISLPHDLAGPVQPDVHLTGWWLMPGFILLAIAQVMRRGVAMRAELDTVI